MTLDELMAKEYKPDYTCAHFFIDAWEATVGTSLPSDAIDCLLPSKAITASKASRAFTPIDKPVSPCMVLFKGNGAHTAHVGLFVNGKVLHMSSTLPVRQPLSVVKTGFNKVSFYNVYDITN